MVSIDTPRKKLPLESPVIQKVEKIFCDAFVNMLTELKQPF